MLRLARTAVTDAGLAHLAPLVALHELDLAHTAITDAGLARLPAAHWHGLRALDLSGTAVTDRGLAYLVGFDELMLLNLAGTAVTDAGLAHLAELARRSTSRTVSVRLGGTAVTTAAVAALEGTAPRLAIVYVTRSGFEVDWRRATSGGGTAMQESATTITLAWTEPQSGESRTQAVTLPATIGRGSAATLRLIDPAISREHARLEWADRDVVLFDLSANGTSVNGRRLPRAVLAVGDTLEIGPYLLTVRALPAPAPAMSPAPSPLVTQPVASFPSPVPVPAPSPPLPMPVPSRPMPRGG